MRLFNFLRTSCLEPSEILFLDYIEGCPTKDLSLPKYWKYEYHLKPKKVINKFKRLNYIKESDYKFNIANYKVVELKEVLKKYNLKVSGKKSQLVERIIKEIPEEDCKRIFNKSYYQLTEKAHELLKDNQHIIYAHKRRNYLNISIYEVDSMKKKMPDKNMYEIFLIILNNQLKGYSKNKDWGLYRCILYNKSLIYHDMGEYEKELKLLCEVCYRDLSGLGNSGIIDSLEISTLAPAVVDNLIEAKENLNLSDNQLKNFYFDSISSINLPFHYFTNELTWEILYGEIYEDEKTLEELYKKGKQRPLSKNYI